MIFTEALTKKFDDFIAVDNVNLNVPTGQVLVLLGPNGAGKTTTIRMLTSVLKPTSGKATVGGYDVISQADKVRASVGVLTEHHGLYGRMNAQEYLDFYARLYRLPIKKSNQRINDLLEQFGLINERYRRLGEYSKGMRQKLALVRALIHEPPVLLLDEPTSAMDPESARIVRDSIINLKSKDRTIILCTHNLLEAEELADQIAIIRLGQIIMSGSVEKLKRTLLGPVEYEIKLTSNHELAPHLLPSGVKIIQQADHIIRFSIKNPLQTNWSLLQAIIKGGGEVLAFQEVPRSLEAAYLKALSRSGNEEINVS